MSNKLNSSNIFFKNNVPLIKLVDEINKSDVCLGIFGSTEKTQMVIPNKIYECIACRKLVITANTKAINELFNEKDIYLIQTANAGFLSEAILMFKNNPTISSRFIDSSYKKFTENATPIILGGQLINLIKELIK